MRQADPAVRSPRRKAVVGEVGVTITSTLLEGLLEVATG
jgi:hypothetical protein